MRALRERRLAAALTLVGALLLGLLVPGAGGAGPGPQAKALRHRQATIAGRSRSTLLSLYSLDSRLAQARSALATLRTRETDVRAREAQARHDMAVAQEVWRGSVRILGDHLRTMYEEGEPDAIAILLGATSLDDAVTRLDALERSARLSRQAIESARASRRSLARLERSLSARAAELHRLVGQAEQTAAALEQARSARVAYLASLARERRLNAATISRLDASAQRIAARSQVVTAQQGGSTGATPPGTTAPPPPLPPTNGRTLTVSATGYSLPGRTATGLPVGWGVVAVDPGVIPLGTRMTIPGYGEGVAADTGSAIQGATIDLWFPTSAQALTWGRRTVTITLH